MCEAVNPEESRKLIRRRFSRIGLAVLTALVVNTGVQVALMMVLERSVPGWRENPWLFWGVMSGPVYLLALPVGVWVLRGLPKTTPTERALGAGKTALTVVVSLAAMYLGNIVGNLITSLLGALIGGPVENPVVTLTDTTGVLPRILMAAVVAPVMEEYFFRKVLIDRLLPYGGKLAVVMSALLFGLFHVNFSQFFYAAALGAVFGYIYLETGRLRYSIGLHMMVNFLGGVVGPELANAATNATSELAAGFWTAILGGYGLLMLNLVIVGVIVVCTKRKSVTFAPAQEAIPGKKPLRAVWCNGGMLLFLAVCLIMIAVSVFA